MIFNNSFFIPLKEKSCLPKGTLPEEKELEIIKWNFLIKRKVQLSTNF